MSVNHITPAEADGVRLYYRRDYEVQQGRVGGHYKGPAFIPPKGNDEKGLFRLLDPDNVSAQIRLYRWFMRKYQVAKAKGADHFSGLVVKDDLMRQCFGDSPSISKVRVGRLLRLTVQYDVNFQKNPAESTGWKTIMLWRWSHYLDFAYGLEHLMALWLPRVIESDGGFCSTDEEFREELEILMDQTAEEDRELIATILSKNLF